MDVSGALAETQRAYVQRAQESSRHLLRLVGDVLDFSKSETARLAVAHEEVGAAETARGALALVRPQAAGRLLTLVDDTAGAAGLRYRGRRVPRAADPGEPALQRHQVHPRRRPRDAGVPRAAGRDGAAAAALLFVVSDSGEGVKPEDADRIFEPFVQGAAGLTRRHGGTGLGLPISRRLARLMGGDVTLDAHRRPRRHLYAAASRGGAVAPVGIGRGDGRARPGGRRGRRGGGDRGGRRPSRGLAAAGEALLRQVEPHGGRVRPPGARGAGAGVHGRDERRGRGRPPGHAGDRRGQLAGDPGGRGRRAQRAAGGRQPHPAADRRAARRAAPAAGVDRGAAAARGGAGARGLPARRWTRRWGTTSTRATRPSRRWSGCWTSGRAPA